MRTISLTHLVFTGPRQEAARVDFGLGLNLIYGPSNTGKSAILDAIDFMLGRSRALKELPEHEGYESIFLGLKTSEGDKYTLHRSITGGGFGCYEGLHYERPEGLAFESLKLDKPTKQQRSLPDFLLGLLSLKDKRLRKNSRNETERLTLRNFVKLFIIDEMAIQKEGSPYISGQHNKQTVERSRLRLMLTGIDDSALVPEEQEKYRLSRQARIHLLDELISEQEDAIESPETGVPDRSQLLDQLERVQASILNEQRTLLASEADYRSVQFRRNQARQQLEFFEERLAEIREMLARFRLLYQQYESDIQRLDNLIEAGTLFAALPSETCPLCGAIASAHHSEEECSDDTEDVVSAATSEKNKIEALRRELVELIHQLEDEQAGIGASLPNHQDQLLVLDSEIESLRPDVMQHREMYSVLIETKTKTEKSLALLDDLERLESKKREIEGEEPERSSEADNSSNVPTKSLHKLSKEVSDLLTTWGLPDATEVHYDKDEDDFVIGGKKRASNGKGHRALTHAAATLALMRYTEQNSLPFPGFVILDSPLLAYEKPEDDEQNLAKTDINKRFFDYVSLWNSRQIIVLENKKSVPDEYEEGQQIIHFTKSVTNGRYGFFPTKASG